jgi:cytoskeletal protein CcmA (bactofilin family)
MVFGTKRDQRQGEPLAREDVVGNLYPDSLSSTDVEGQTPSAPTVRRPDERDNMSVIDPHARFNGKYVSDRDLRIDGEAQGEIECQGTLIISPQARVRSAIKAHNVVVNGDYEGDVDCGGRFEIGSTGRVKGQVKTQVLVVKEGAHWEGSVLMSREGGARASQPGTTQATGPGRPASGTTGSIFTKQERESGGGQPAA